MKDFVPVESARESLLLLREAERILAPATLWTPASDNHPEWRVETHFMSHPTSDKHLLVECPRQVKPADVMDRMAQSGSKVGYFSVPLSAATIFFKAPFSGLDPKGLRFGIPDKVFKLQRRGNMRWKVPIHVKIPVEFLEPANLGLRVQRPMHDLSAGGISIRVPFSESDRYPAGTELRELTFTLVSASTKRKFTLKGKVRQINALRADDPTSDIKVGIVFDGIPEKDAQAIAAFVFEEGRKTFSRLL